MNANDCVVSACNVLTLQDLIAELLCVLLNILECLVLTDKLAELIVCIIVSVLGEVDRVLYHSNIILGSHSATVCYLHDDVTLCKRQIACLVHTQCIKGAEQRLGIAIKRCATLIHSRGEPYLLSGLTILHSEGVKVCTSL